MSFFLCTADISNLYSVGSQTNNSNSVSPFCYYSKSNEIYSYRLEISSSSMNELSWFQAYTRYLIIKIILWLGFGARCSGTITCTACPLHDNIFSQPLFKSRFQLLGSLIRLLQQHMTRTKDVFLLRPVQISQLSNVLCPSTFGAYNINEELHNNTGINNNLKLTNINNSSDFATLP